MKLRFNLTLMILVLASFEGCTKPKSSDDGDASTPLNQSQNDEFSRPVPLTMDSDTKRWWISKANRTMRLSKSLQSMKDTAELESLPAEEIIDRMQNTKDFYDMIADFTSYWLGNKGLDIWANYGGNTVHISRNFVRNTAVINSVKKFYDGEDYFGSLFSTNGFPIDAGYSPAYLKNGTQPQIPHPEIRQKIRDGFWKNKQKLTDFLNANDASGFCNALFDNETEFSIADLFFGIGGAGNFNSDVFSKKILAFQMYCIDPTSASSSEVLQKLNDFETTSDQLIAGANAMQPPNNDYMAAFRKDHVVDLNFLKNSSYDQLAADYAQFDDDFFSKIPNSSTNRNRKRAAWVLKRFFCDDLTPINVEAPSEHGDGVHGSQASCYSCHYKLDPMAGYFRHLGNGGRSYEKFSKIIYDDFAISDRSEYEKPWRSSSSERSWNIGYIRDLKRTESNTYGETFGDLLQLLKTAPEVKQCFVKRVAQYMLGESQTMDSGYLNAIADRFVASSKVNATQAFKNVFKEIALSNTFVEKDPISSQCYDFAASSAQGSRAPCRIASILERNCTSCHSSNGPSGGLDLTKWSKIGADSVTGSSIFGFPHVEGETQLSKSESLKRINDRLQTPDSNLRMPLMKTMPSAEREELFLWLQKNL
ncbi:MAG: hypothetical protein NT027_08680 [Proteobacteria bacterium]|nr:hypothetical protein [Pseudomonadota bacterium]